ncbi:hypothetical protein HAX54_014621 [Datura stramonium]|uniref:Uncharacterized protein n=1 Tax=Datura stramonium TaxID=4076 RepID=A0ABS8TQH3_DATST|nr:hypothetical protein [Datura stramonium]
MNQYGKLELWVEKFVVDLNGGISDAIEFTRNGEFLVVQYPGDLLSYDPESWGLVYPAPISSAEANFGDED